jgi:hypothetical protein
MAAFMLESLVLRGVCVLRDEAVVGLRLGASAKANMHAPGIRNSRHPLPGGRKPAGQTGSGPDVDYSTKGDMPGAGRSRRPFGARSLPEAATCRAISAGFAVRQSEVLRVERGFTREVLETLPVTPCWRKPDGRTPPESKREIEGR